VGAAAYADERAAEPATPTAEVARYAGFWRRVGASAIDSALLLGVLVVALIAMSAAGMSDATVGVVYTLASWIGGWLYYALMHSSSHQATVGKRAVGIKVTDLAGERIGFARATGRYFATILSSLTLFIGFVMAGFTERRQTLHDMLASTLVVSRNATPQAVATGLQAPQVSGGIVALAVIAILVPIAGVLAAIAIPAYQDYLIRSQVSEGLTAAAAYKQTVAEAIAAGASFADINTTMPNTPEAATSPHVDTIQVTHGVVVITYGGAADQRLSGQQVALVPGTTVSGDLVWICGRASIPDGVTPAIRAHAQYTSVGAKYLPTTCRGE
jgi:uncharacterized RDD family membrane protein YckC/Tfp pilus assembly major pilin PilA